MLIKKMICDVCGKENNLMISPNWEEDLWHEFTFRCKNNCYVNETKHACSIKCAIELLKNEGGE